MAIRLPTSKKDWNTIGKETVKAGGTALGAAAGGALGFAAGGPVGSWVGATAGANLGNKLAGGEGQAGLNKIMAPAERTVVGALPQSVREDIPANVGGDAGRNTGGGGGGGYGSYSAGAMPDFLGIESSHGVLKDQLRYDVPQEVVNRDALYHDAQGGDMYRALQSQALQDSSQSPWLKLQLERQSVEQSQLADQAAKQAAMSAAQARSSMGMRGGFSGGGARLAAQAMRAQNAARQGVMQQGMLGRLGLQTSAEEQRQKALALGTGLEADFAKTNAANQYAASRARASDDLTRGMFNVQNRMGIDIANKKNLIETIDKQNDWRKTQWMKNKEQEAGGIIAKAIANGGNKGLFGGLFG